jgi:hypothetical protein
MYDTSASTPARLLFDAVTITTRDEGSANNGRSLGRSSVPLTRTATASLSRRAASSAFLVTGRYRSTRAVPAPAITASACVRSSWNSSRSAAPATGADRPPTATRPSAVAAMFSAT